MQCIFSRWVNSIEQRSKSSENKWEIFEKNMFLFSKQIACLMINGIILLITFQSTRPRTDIQLQKAISSMHWSVWAFMRKRVLAISFLIDTQTDAIHSTHNVSLNKPIQNRPAQISASLIYREVSIRTRVCPFHLFSLSFSHKSKQIINE